MNSHTIPLPPNFLPAEYDLGDLVEVVNHVDPYNGLWGKITRLPTSTTYRNGGDRRYEIEITSKNGSANYAYFEPKNLKKYVKGERIEGYEINHEEVQIGDTIRTVIESGDGSYRHVSSKEGKVIRVAKKIGLAHKNDHPAFVYSFADARNHALTFEHRDEKITLVKAAENPYKAIVEALAAGSVVVRENENGSVYTYVKSVDWHTSSQWHVVNSLSCQSSTFVSDEDVIRILYTTDAEIVHKVRKPKPVVDVNVPF